MTRSAPLPPPEVLEALETLERATSPADIGPAYQTVLDWRRINPRAMILHNLLPVFWALAVIAVVLFAIPLLSSMFSFEVTDYWRGFLVGMVVMSLVYQLSPPKRRTPPPSIETRIETAIDRWRHAVPAMREMPR
jgi:hypothetical protein